MFRPITMAAVLSLVLGAIGVANAATYCASYVGGPERANSRSTCHYASLAECRASIRARGGGHCYKKGQMR
jgi:hypothetical protein